MNVTVLLISATVALLCSLVLTRIVRDVFLRLGIVDLPDARKIHSRAIPRVGGIAIAIAYVFAWQAARFGSELLPHLSLWEMPAPPVLVAWAVGLIFAIGIVDDFRGLDARQKFAGQIAGAALAWAGGVRITVFQDLQLDGFATFALTVFWLVACTNAFNLIDGLDGLAAGVALFATGTIFVSAMTYGSIGLMCATAPLMGALLGFLRYNYNGASIFLGDSGSLTLGFALGCFAVVWGQKSATLIGMAAPLMCLSLPLVDTAVAITRRFLRNQPVFDADRGHIHHRLLDQGLSPRRAALTMYTCCCFAAAFALLHNVFAIHFGAYLVLAFVALLILVLRKLRYPEFGAAVRLVVQGRLRRRIQAEIRLEQLRQLTHASDTPESCWGILCSELPALGVAGVRLSGVPECREAIFDTRFRSCWSIRMPIGQVFELELLFAGHFGRAGCCLDAICEIVCEALVRHYTAPEPVVALDPLGTVGTECSLNSKSACA
jgi:UDP-GlcNAc:undecaprenyl-phosphate/decaprenyl-phosphate GlcNAc-1-phosphate transferase